MERSRTALARAVDALADAGRATVTESRTELALYQLNGASARSVAALLAPAGFSLARLADEGGDLLPDQLDESAERVELVATKPATPADVFPVLTANGFRAIMVRAPEQPTIWVEGIDRDLITATTAYRPWGSAGVFLPDATPPDPARVVRELTGRPVEAIGRWLVRDPDADTAGRVLSPWRIRAAEVLAAALAQEVEPDGSLLFRGPPPTRFRSTGATKVDVGSLAALQRAAGWVYENPRELENRHGLLAAEVSRASLRDGDLADLAAVAGVALEGARIAYGFGVSQQSRDALKTLSDLRKAVADETGKVAEATRSLATAVLAAAVGNVGLVVARVTIAKDARFVAPAAVAIGVALAVYVGLVIGSGAHFLAIQRDLRRDWRDRLYRFLGHDEYRRMVDNPIGRAEKAFRNAAIGSGIIAALMLGAVILIATH
jgi:hypothetical protein